MVGINLLNYMDRWVGSAVAPLIQEEFKLNDFRVGLLGSAFTLVYALAALPFGLWADRGVRKTVIGTGVAIWSAATLLTGSRRISCSCSSPAPCSASARPATTRPAQRCCAPTFPETTLPGPCRSGQPAPR